MSNKGLTIHCLVKNEENFIVYAIESVIRHAEEIIIFDTGSSDTTVERVKKLMLKYPGKIIFEEKGESSKERHTELRNEMINRTNTEWFMILDGDEVWTERGMKEVVGKTDGDLDCLVAPFYLCVGDIYHASWRGHFNILGRKAHATPRIFRNKPGLHWSGEYESDSLLNEDGSKVYEGKEIEFIEAKFWHLTHLERSSVKNDFSSGGNRGDKEVSTYFLVGHKIDDNIPEVLQDKKELKMSWLLSFFNFFKWVFKKFLH